MTSSDSRQTEIFARSFDWMSGSTTSSSWRFSLQCETIERNRRPGCVKRLGNDVPESVLLSCSLQATVAGFGNFII
jgi:hypothetical protein